MTGWILVDVDDGASALETISYSVLNFDEDAPFVPVRCLDDLVAGFAQRDRDSVAQVGLVVDQQDSLHDTTGIFRMKVAPRPGSLSTSSQPPCDSTTLRARASPMPEPDVLVVKNG